MVDAYALPTRPALGRHLGEKTMTTTGPTDEPPVLYASFTLPLPIVVKRDALGLTVSGRIGEANITARLPARQDPDEDLDTDDYTLATQRVDPVSIPSTGRIVRDWNQPASDLESPDAVDLRRILMQVTGKEADLGPSRPGVGPTLEARLADEVFRLGNRWQDALRSWVEVLTLQDLDHVHPRWTAHIEGAGIATFGADGRRLGFGGLVRLDSSWPQPATRHDMETALTEASAGRFPPLAHLLLRDARAAWHRMQVRRAVIDAATATEVSLSQVGRAAGVLRAGKSLMLGRLVEKLEADGLLSPEIAGELFSLVVRPRNSAVHGGIAPSAWNAAEACKAAQRQVWNAFPL